MECGLDAWEKGQSVVDEACEDGSRHSAILLDCPFRGIFS